jgi:hypothetical protein
MSVRRYVRRAAFGTLLAAPVLAASAIPVPSASATTAGPAVSTSACHLPGHRQAPSSTGPDGRTKRPIGNRGRSEGLIGNLSPAPGSTVAVGSTISFLIADERPFPTPLSRDVAVTVNGVRVTATAGAEESGVPVTYANRRDKGSRSASCEVPFSFALPSSVSGSAHVQVTAHDGDGDKETVRWTLTVQTTTVPTGAVGGIVMAAAGGLVLLVVQVRRRRGPSLTHG